MSTKSPEFQQAKADVLERLATSSSESPPKSERVPSPVFPSGATPFGSEMASGGSEGAEAPALSGDPAAPMAPEPAPDLTPPEAKPGTALTGGGSLSPIPANEPLDKWGTGGGIAWLAEYERMSRLVAGTVTLPKDLKLPRDILAVALTGRELGIGFMEATRMVYIIHGRPALAAELKVKLAREAGHDLGVGTESPESCTAVCQTHEVAASFTLAEARQAGLVKEDSGWAKYPADLLWARAVTRLIRRHCPGVQGASLRSVEELSDAPAGGD